MRSPLNPPPRILLGPGPSDVSSSVLAAMAKPIVGHLDPYFLSVMDDVREMLREVFGTTNELTMPMSGTGSAGMETCLVNLLEHGSRALVGVHGVFGTRLAEVARRCGAEVETVNAPWGRPLDLDDLKRAAAGRAFDLMCIVHAETSTGVLQPLEGLRDIADACGALLLVDAVTSIGGLAIDVDRHGIDAIYAGTQKCLSCPPGLAPISFSARAKARLERRMRPPQSWYLDLQLISAYWGGERAYHHTAPISMMYALHEALRSVVAEGLSAREERHRLHARALASGLEALGLTLPVPREVRLPPLTLVRIPEGIDDLRIRRELLADYGLEIGGGLGEFRGKAWRIGLMGEASTRRNVMLCLAALTDVLARHGHRAPGDPLAAARTVWSEEARIEG